MRAASTARSPAAFAVIELAAGDVHLVQDGVHALREHARTVGIKVEAAFVADDGLVDAALVALALVEGLKKQKKMKTTKFLRRRSDCKANLIRIRFQQVLKWADNRCI